MTIFLLIGAALGGAIGLAHAIDLYRRRAAAGRTTALWFGAWSVLLWTVFGPYLLAFWILGAVGLSLSRLAGAVR